ncbi:hypothetical protein [Enterobacter sp. Bisph1]|uniref:hypothetical protein n=1 Tax=Enterobacter sp. Bisph1 TaxID=1274399 RepID=UPI00057BF1B0|nr:hypothetical protein [Enterobacter sp. Bisph1]
MKLIIKQYLSSLKERSELDIILPSLLSHMGLNVFARPIRGTNEYGVDIAAVGKINQDKECVYLFSVKSGNLTRSTWHSGTTDQTLRPSLESILDSYIPHRLPPEHRNKPVVICLCFGGDIQTNVRQEVTGFTNKYTTNNISFEEWNGDKLSDLIIEHLLNEDLLPKNWQSLLRKSIALLDEPYSSHQNFRQLVLEISRTIGENDKSQVTLINTINICLWILYSWCRDEDNIESAYLSAESAILYVWDVLKKNFTLKQKTSFDELISTYQKITEEYVQKCILPFCKNLHAISRGINTQCSIDINLKLFDILGRVAMHGEWLLYRLQKSHIAFPPSEGENQEQLEIRSQIERISKTIQELVSNNPLLLSPFKDDQAIDISLAAHVLLQNSNNEIFLQGWIKNLADRIMFSYKANIPSIYMHATTLTNYDEILEYKNDDNHKLLREKYTQGSILYPTLMMLAEILIKPKFKEDIVEFCNENLKHCTLQFWFPNHTSENYYYNNNEIHGSSFSEITETQYFSLQSILMECKSSSIDKLSAIKHGYAPLLLLASRHYRYPVPLHFFTTIIEDTLDNNKL